MNELETLLAVLTVSDKSVYVYDDENIGDVVNVLGGVDVLIYTGSSPDSFLQYIKTYKAPPSANSRRYKKLNFSEITVWS